MNKKRDWASQYMNQVDAGYEGQPEEEEPLTQLWLMAKIPSGVHGGILGQIICNGEVRGTIHLKNEGEYNWLQHRVNSERQLRIGSN